MRKRPLIVREYSTGGFIKNQKGNQPDLCSGERIGGFWQYARPLAVCR